MAAPGTTDPGLREEGERLARERAALEEEQERLSQARVDLRTAEAAMSTAFATFSDPRRGITSLGDHTPIVLMPLRLETRFKDVSIPAAPAPRHELWVRICPDDCWIDTFDPTLSEDEVRNVRSYWVDVWQAGRIEAQAQAAWRVLVGKHGAGRGAWLVDHYQPLNAGNRPAKTRATDLILTIPVDARHRRRQRWPRPRHSGATPGRRAAMRHEPRRPAPRSKRRWARRARTPSSRNACP